MSIITRPDDPGRRAEARQLPDAAPVSGPSVRRDTESRLEIDAARPRQTERAGVPFRNVLSGGVSLLMSGVEVATHVVAGPVLAAAVHEAGANVTTAVAAPRPTTPGVFVGRRAGPDGSPVAGEATVPSLSSTSEGSLSNLQLLTLQQQIQQENQRFTTLSNVMRARHDTAKAAVSNIRA